MSDVDLAAGVAVRLPALCLDRTGRLRTFDLWDDAARGAMLVDLAWVGRLTHEADSVSVDGSPTGFEPADRLLATIAVEPEHRLDWWMAQGGAGMHDLAEANVASGRWIVRRRLVGRRFTDSSPVSATDRALNPRRPDDTWSPETAAVMVLGLACGAFGRPEPVAERGLAATGPLRWICEAVTAHLDAAHRRNLRAAGAADGGVVPYY
jgi:hypothetical protein